MRANRHPREPSGFTLIEILIVVSIGLVLAAMAVSAGKSIQVKSRQATSANNLRQWGVAMGGHTADHNGALPRRGQGRQKLGLIDRPKDWFNVLPSYLGEKPYQELVATGKMPKPGDASIFICPGAPTPSTGVRYPLGYGMNMNLSPWNFPAPTLIAQISSLSTVVFMAESPGDYASIYPSASAYSLIAPHDGKGNVLFLDGHVECYPAGYLGCHKGDPKHPDVSWKTGTDSDANSDSY